ncbi:phytanoyl-CoA dioxygenase family protein [Massilia rhizosphaerae]|uniref:phytanoyl-CoA dioxygenase family protein n=1 Tax=Massilia rhizosphaerae TaxID=2784389 RepID=UPI00351DA725
MLIDTFLRDGFAVIPTVVTESQCDAIAACVGSFDSDSPGTRSLLTHDWCRTLAETLRAHADVDALIPAGHVAVQCTYFEKSVDKNWLVPIHQDLSIPVRERVDHPALRGWSEKEGTLFVQPPAELLETLVAVRVHLDPCMEDDGPLQIVPGTHARGRIDAADARRFRRDGPVVTCTVDRGGALVMRPLALHASSKATGTCRRRVLHFVFGPPALPYGLRWEHAAGQQIGLLGKVDGMDGVCQ